MSATDTYRVFGTHRPSCSLKKRGTCEVPLSSSCRRRSRCASSTFAFAVVAASMSFAWIAAVSSVHSLQSD